MSETKFCQFFFAISKSSPLGLNGLFLTYSIVLLSTAINPVVAPASIVILHNVILASIERFLIALPVYSIA